MSILFGVNCVRIEQICEVECIVQILNFSKPPCVWPSSLIAADECFISQK